MIEKIAIAKQLRISRDIISKKFGHKDLFTKCYYTYILECIIKGKDDFKLSFGGIYIESFSDRLFDWLCYLDDCIYRFFLIIFIPTDDDTLRKYHLIHHGASKPIHLKIAETPNEWCLYYFLEKNGFKITNEQLFGSSTVYYVSRA